jgi:hypothetical protein
MKLIMCYARSAYKSAILCKLHQKINMKIKITGFILILLCFYSQSVGQMNKTKNKNIKFVSFPDFFNFDIPEPWPQYDTAVNYFLSEVKKEKPNFVLIDGDLVNGHWWDSPSCVQHMGNLYYPAWKRRMDKFGFKYYTAIGDHELGDDPWPKEKVKLIPAFEKAYTSNLYMPQNGPDYKKGLAYYVREGNLLLITVETFEITGDTMYTGVIGEQLAWMEKVLEQNKDAIFKIVQGHVGLWGEIKSRSSSKLMHVNGKNSDFYKLMARYGVDLYLAGEFHDVTILESEGIWQIVHGSSWGREIVNTEDYLVGELKDNVLNLSMKRIFMDAQGEYMWNLNKDKGPRETVKINERTLKNGPETIGTLIISSKNGKKEYSSQTGVFIQEKKNE